jgi:hypothetical protein
MNVNGLSQDKFVDLVQSVSTSSTSAPSLASSFDVIFVAETWFVSGFDRILAHPLSLISSPLLHRRSTGHQLGGLLLLVSPYVRSLVTSTRASEFSITLSLACLGRSISVTGVYFPPHLSSAEVSWELIPMNDSSVIIGDINVRFGAAFQDDQIGPRDRLLIFQTFKASRNLHHLHPASGFARVDHVYLAPQAFAFGIPTLNIVPQFKTVRSDHPMLSLSLRSLTLMLTYPSPGFIDPAFRLTRYQSRYLEHAYTRDLLVARYEAFWCRACFSSYACRAPASQVSLDAIDACLLKMVDLACEDVLGSYDAIAVQSTPDLMSVGNLVHGNQFLPHRLMAFFKRSHRASRHDVLTASRDPSKTAVEDAVMYYQELYASRTPPSFDDTDMGVSPSPVLMDLFDECSIAEAIKRYPSNKSPGSDGLTGQVLKSLVLSPSFSTHLACLFRCCVRFGMTPSRWNESILFPIPKVDLPSSPTIANMRPISMTAIFRRIFESIIHQAITHADAFASLRHFNYGQAGFRRSFSTLSQVLVSHDSVRLGYVQKVFLDLRNAYDRVPLERVLVKLSGRAGPSGLLSIVRSLFSGCSSRCVINGQISTVFARGRGLFQGSLLSPWLFNTFIDDLADRLNPDESQIPAALFFADDIQLQAKRASDLQPLLDTVLDWTLENGMELNLDKSAHVQAALSFSAPSRLEVHGNRFPSTVSYKYLGFPHTSIGVDFKAHVKDAVEKATKVLNYCRFSGHFDHLPELCRLTLYKTFVRPVLEYGAPLVTQWLLSQDKSPRPRSKRRKKPPSDSTWRSLEAVQDLALQWVFHTKLAVPILRSLSGLGLLRDRFQELAARFTTHLDRLPPDHPVRLFSSESIPTLSRLCSSHPLTTLLARCLSTTKTAFARLRLGHISVSSILASRVSWTCRHPRSFYDLLLKLPDNILRRSAIRWRTGSFGRLDTCLGCSAPFSTSHIAACSLLPVGPETLHDALNSMDYEIFSALISTLSSRLSRYV